MFPCLRTTLHPVSLRSVRKHHRIPTRDRTDGRTFSHNPQKIAPVPHERNSVCERQLRQACADLDERLRAGESCRAERFFSLYPLLACHEEYALELIYTEFVAREEMDQRPTPEEFYARFPHWRRRLERQFQVHELLRDNLSAAEETVADAAPPLPRRGPSVGQRLGRYELLEELACGGCGVVFRAWQDGLERTVAVKALRPELAHRRPVRQRFAQEAKLMAALRHRHIMPVHDIGESDGVLYFSMDFAASGSLAQRIADRPGPPDATTQVQDLKTLAVVARAVHHAHRQGVVHGDLKPSNILLDEDGEPLVSDFGLARPADVAPDALTPFAGTPAYMAPALLDGRPATTRSDVWALGVILFETLTGQRPFQGGSLAELRRCVEAGPPPMPGVDGRLAGVVGRCLAVEPGERFASAAELADALSAGSSELR
jgi:hypothetical protein